MREDIAGVGSESSRPTWGRVGSAQRIKTMDVTVRVPALEKLVDYGASGVGAVAGPMLANWRASREGAARLTSARIDAEVRRLGGSPKRWTPILFRERSPRCQERDHRIHRSSGNRWSSW